jgi:DHA1 family bicyclomycin/chloramphenicol resistance-like MFS transporter
VGLAIWLRIAEPSLLSVMAPVGAYTFGIAFVMPSISTAVLAPFPHIAGAASSMSGFFQMGSGLVGGTIAALVGNPVMAIATIIPAMGLIAIVSWLVWRRIPEPEHRPAVPPG